MDHGWTEVEAPRGRGVRGCREDSEAGRRTGQGGQEEGGHIGDEGAGAGGGGDIRRRRGETHREGDERDVQSVSEG